MNEIPAAHPPIVTREDWQAARATLLADEKALTRQYDRVAASRRRLPMVKMEKEYVFGSPDSPLAFADLFGDARQLVVYHFMYGPDWESGCPVCSGFIDAIGPLETLRARDTVFALIARAPQAKLDAWRALRGWDIPFHSSFGSEFNFDFGVSDERGEGQGISVFFRIGRDVFHTYSTGSRGVERVTDSYSLLDLTPFGRQEDFENSPPGWPQRPTYG